MVRAMSDDLYNDARWLVGAIARGLHARGGSHVDVVLQRLAEQDMTREDFVEPRPQGLPVTRYFADTIAETMMIESELAAAIASLMAISNGCNQNPTPMKSSVPASARIMAGAKSSGRRDFSRAMISSSAF